MALQILEKNGTFELCGNLNTKTSRSFIIHFEYLINTLKDVTINIDKIKAIDSSGVEALKTLIAISLKNNSIFYIIGKGCKDIYAHNRSAFAA
jgi:ABC-type transporter Mla MlaB component|tara:strand:- start:140164 stop:140442 length:279 start_codon:yes stop_codon:yes gene_type:complete